MTVSTLGATTLPSTKLTSFTWPATEIIHPLTDMKSLAPFTFLTGLILDRGRITNSDGFLKSYVYFDGTPYRGLGRASVSLDAARGVV